MEYEGTQTGRLIDGEGDGIFIEIHMGSVNWQRIHKFNVQPFDDHQVATIKEVYDQNLGAYVAGFEIHDRKGYPTGETYRLNQFDISGNLSTGHSERINGWGFI